MVFSLSTLADTLGMGRIWGEATASSAPFYEKVLRIRSVQDSFVIRQQKMRRVRERYLARIRRRLAETGSRGTIADMKAPRKRDWLDECFDYEATHPIAFASPRALLEARMIEAMDKARRPQRRAHRNGVALRRKTVAG